jgi:GNAT superfamily N-acetyltransferase
MRIERKLITELPDTLQNELKKRIEREFGNVPIVKEHVWAEPTWLFTGYIGDQVVSFLNIVDRHVLADGETVRFFGLNNVITEPEHRGQGYSRELNKAAVEFMSELDKSAFGFLFCADNLIPFYTDLGWKRFEGEVTVSQPSGDKLWPSNAMLYTLSCSKSWKKVHLCGLPW